MIILPAIDIKDGCCVRLRRGDFATAHKVAEDAVQTAAAFSTAGAAWIHMVDLDGAKEGGAKNEHIFLEVARHSGLRVELGGGIRDMQTLEPYFSRGISRSIWAPSSVSICTKQAYPRSIWPVSAMRLRPLAASAAITSAMLS